MTNKEKFLKLVSEKDKSFLSELKLRKEKRAMLIESQKIAYRILERLDELNWTQKQLAQKMGVSAQQVNKIVKGQENLTLETQTKLQEILDIPILATFYENKMKEWVNNISFTLIEEYAPGKMVKMDLVKEEASPYQLVG